MTKMFDRNELQLRPLTERVNDLDLSVIKEIDRSIRPSAEWRKIGEGIIKAKKEGRSVVLSMGAHVIRAGVQKYVIDLMKRGYISCIAVNGACAIHDFEFALIGATTESVAKYIKDGKFGLWKETGAINDVINKTFKQDPAAGYGAALGEHILKEGFKYKDISIFAQAFKLNVPVTVHIGVGYDIIHEHPNFDAAASGALSYNDFLAYAEVLKNLSGGVLLNFGTAVMGPEVFLKALSMARNVAAQKGSSIKDFMTVVCDLQDVGSQEPVAGSQGPVAGRQEPGHRPPASGYLPSNDLQKTHPAYYFRPLKTLLVRTLDGGESNYIRGDHAATVPELWASINEAEKHG